MQGCGTVGSPIDQMIEACATGIVVRRASVFFMKTQSAERYRVEESEIPRQRKHAANRTPRSRTERAARTDAKWTYISPAAQSAATGLVWCVDQDLFEKMT